MTTIYKIITALSNPVREYTDLWDDYDDAMNYFNGVKNNKDIISIEVVKMQNSEDSSFLQEVEVIASFS